ncbi:bifunctional adenosylcobinamide kinase/adenosylcobinamide-phosphate guanylyltransferase [bacterium]|nr:bifunctional adenosylcobinamide kinase/adenosylcobinamide-phosphate guanylyltransferase [bacterium]
MNPTLVFITGGARSGKSRYALQLAQSYQKKTFLATGVITDNEMEDRVAHHRRERGSEWLTLEEPLEVAKQLEMQAQKVDLILIDCLTSWISNLLLADEDEIAILIKVGELLTWLKARTCAIIVVSNEVGMGVVPDNPLGRKFRDLVGHANQEVARLADRSVLMVAGLPLDLR